jgi:hypothetical protein
MRRKEPDAIASSLQESTAAARAIASCPGSGVASRLQERIRCASARAPMELLFQALDELDDLVVAAQLILLRYRANWR